MTPQEWKNKYPEAAAALAEIQNQAVAPTRADYAGFSETAIQQRARLNAAQAGGVLWRNNVGALLDKRGVPVRYGLFNDTEKMNELNKSPDLVGILPRLITPDLLGTTIGQFWGVEVKEAGWRYRGDAHELAQLNGLNLIRRFGGIADFYCGA